MMLVDLSVESGGPSSRGDSGCPEDRREMTFAELPGPGLTQDQWTHIRTLAVSLSPQQMAWVSGYFAGFDEASRGGASMLDIPASQDGANGSSRTLTILYASETGNSAYLARTLEAELRSLGLTPSLRDRRGWPWRCIPYRCRSRGVGPPATLGDDGVQLARNPSA
jgi:hypothetical protein